MDIGMLFLAVVIGIILCKIFIWGKLRISGFIHKGENINHQVILKIMATGLFNIITLVIWLTIFRFGNLVLFLLLPIVTAIGAYFIEMTLSRRIR